MDLTQLVGLAAIVNPDFARQMVRMLQEDCVRELAREAGLHPIIADIAIQKLRGSAVKIESDTGRAEIKVV